MRKGQVLIELMLALAVTTLALLAMVGLATKSLSTVGSSKYRAQASTYATQGMEWVRQERMADWDIFYDRSVGTYCLGSLAWNAGSCAIDGTFNRQLILSDKNTGPERMTATVTVSWSEGTRTPYTDQVTVFTNY